MGLNTKTNFVTNLSPLNLVNKSISLLVITDSVSLSCSSGLKEFQISELKLAKPLKACAHFVIFTFFSFEKFPFLVSLYKELLELTFSAWLIVLQNLCKVFGCSVTTDFVSTMFRFFKVFSLLGNYF